MSIDSKQVQAVFLAATECAQPVERATVLSYACGSDLELKNRVEALLRAHDESEELPRGQLTHFAIGTDATSIHFPGAVIAGRYLLEREIAEGGMGTVWAAQQTEPVRRRVALKLIKPGMDSRRVLARFEAERQALAVMDHPNIAKVFDGGVTDKARPFFVMEYVEGVPITDYCEQSGLTVPERLALVVAVCEAIQHAHQKGIIHRDLKPSNVLVCRSNGRAVPKVIDFGLAKAMYEPLTEHTFDTADGFMAGTPRYMSPEQAEFNNLDIDTRSDVYSLGVILYELLTGDAPLASERFEGASWFEILRLIKEEEPSKPSARVGKSDALEVPPRQSREIAKLASSMRGELDWITMKALAKERSRRYESASALARDIERYLHDEPVDACPPSAAYRFRKFARRNRVTLTTGMLVSGALVVGTVVSTMQAIRATRAERVANVARAAEAEQVKIAKAAQSDAEKQRAQAVANLQSARNAVDDYFTSVSETKLFDVPGLQPLRKELLDSALTYYQRFIDQYGNDPTVQYDLGLAYHNAATVNYDIGSKEQALQTFQKAIDVFERLVHETPSDLRYRTGLANALAMLGNGHAAAARPKEAATRFKRVIELREQVASDDPDNPKRRADLSIALRALANAYTIGDQLDEARSLYARAIEVSDVLAREYPTDVLYQDEQAHNNLALGNLERKAGRRADSEAPYRRAIEVRERFAQLDPNNTENLMDLSVAYNNLFVSLAEMDRLPDAEASFKQALAGFERLARENPTVADHQGRVANTIYNLAFCQRLMGRPGDAEVNYRRSIEMYEALAAENPKVWKTLWGIGNSYYHLGVLHSVEGRPEAAVETWNKAAATFQGMAERGFEISETYIGLGDAMGVLGRWDEAARAFLKTAELTNNNWKPLYQAALLQLVAGDEAGYRRSCAELVSRYRDNAEVGVAVAVAMACTAAPHAVDDLEPVLAMIRRAAATNPKNPVFQTLVGAVEYRAGHAPEAIAILKKSVPMHGFAQLAAPKQIDQLRISRMMGETILTLALRDANDEQAYAKQLASFQKLVDLMASTTPQYSEGLGRWALPMTVLLAKRELERLKPPPIP